MCVCMFMCGKARMSKSPSMWTLGIELRLSGLVVSFFTPELPHMPPHPYPFLRQSPLYHMLIFRIANGYHHAQFTLCGG